MKDTLREECDASEECLRNCCVNQYVAPLFFVVFVLMAQFVLVNVVVAVLMKHLEESHKQVSVCLIYMKLFDVTGFVICSGYLNRLSLKTCSWPSASSCVSWKVRSGRPGSLVEILPLGRGKSRVTSRTRLRHILTKSGNGNGRQ